MKDLANTPTQMACGYQLYDDLERLAALAGETVTVNLIDGTCAIGGTTLTPSLHIARVTHAWTRSRHNQDAIPPSLVLSARLELRPRVEKRRLIVSCVTVVTTERRTFSSEDEAVW